MDISLVLDVRNLSWYFVFSQALLVHEPMQKELAVKVNLYT